jgi:hypothetical protein
MAWVFTPIAVLAYLSSLFFLSSHSIGGCYSGHITHGWPFPVYTGPDYDFCDKVNIAPKISSVGLIIDLIVLFTIFYWSYVVSKIIYNKLKK